VVEHSTYEVAPPTRQGYYSTAGRGTANAGTLGGAGAPERPGLCMTAADEKEH